MLRTQVYFPREMLDQLRREAYEKRKTLAAVIRDKVAKSLKTEPEGLSKREISKRLKLVEEISRLNLPTMSPRRMKKIFSESYEPHL